jgi:hypothetical protein
MYSKSASFVFEVGVSVYLLGLTYVFEKAGSAVADIYIGAVFKLVYPSFVVMHFAI